MGPLSGSDEPNFKLCSVKFMSCPAPVTGCDVRNRFLFGFGSVFAKTDSAQNEFGSGRFKKCASVRIL